MKKHIHTPKPAGIMRVLFAALIPALIPLPTSGFAQVANPPASEDEEIIVLSPFEVQSSSDPYLETNAISGTRFNTTLKELPMPISVLTSEFIKDIGATGISEALEYAGATQNTSTISESVDSPHYSGVSVSLRGYNLDAVYRNGFRSGGNDDVLFVDRVEVIKGPSSVFAGTIGPGGTINIITKRPSGTPGGFVSLRVGSWERTRSEFYWSSPVNKAKTFKYLIGAALEDYGSPYDFGGRRRSVVGSAFEWTPSKKTTISMDVQWLKADVQPALSSAIYLDPSRERRLENAPFDFNRHGPEAYSDFVQMAASLNITHSLGRDWFLKMSAFIRYTDIDQVVTDGSSVVTVYKSGVRTVAIQPRSLNATNYYYVPQVNLFGKLQYLGITHRINVGVDGSFTPKQTNTQYRGATQTINMDYPVYAPYGNLYSFYQDIDVYSKDQGATANNIFTLFGNRLTLLQGYRYGKSYSRLRGMREARVMDNEAHMPSVNIWSFGASYVFTRQISGFVSYAESYVPQGWAFDYQGNVFEPIRGNGYNYGIKADFVKGRLAVQVQGFNIKRFNIQQPDPEHPGFNIASGDEQSDGFEAGVIGRPWGNWRVVGSYAYTDARVTKDPTRPQNVGSRASNKPHNQASLWNRYNWSGGFLKGFNIGIGVTYVDRRRGNPNLADLPGLQLPDYTRVDFALGYATRIFGNPASVTMNISNLFDELYYGNYDGYGPPLNTNVTVRFRF
jgi:iron complex outermembrane receptor protein